MFPHPDLASNEKIVEAFASARDVPLDEARPPAVPGVYGFSFKGKLCYIGEAKGRGGLFDRILRKLLGGDEGHALQRAIQERFPDRHARRAFLKRAILVKWLVAPPVRRSAVERLLITRHRPVWNLR